jgi:hypothetical protein
LVVLFAVTVAAGAAVCQMKTHPNGNSLLPFPCCHVTGAIYAGSMITLNEPQTPYSQAPVAIAPAQWIATIFHPPHA